METLILGVEVLALICMSAVCSGLNVALMSLSLPDLKRKARLGNAHARKVLPLRAKGHLSLASILLTNVAVISATSLVLDEKLGGLIAGIASTLLIVIFGEVVPQALFTRHALAFCARFAPLLKIMIVLTYPVSKSMQLLLDHIIGHERAQLHSRHELGMIISEHLGDNASELDEDEVAIINGALLLSEKRVKEILTPISHVYWLTPDDLIDATRIDEIKELSWSRIPVFNNELTECYGLLLMKDLVDIDFDNEPRKVKDLPLHGTRVTGSMTALDTMFRKFIGARTHLIPVERDEKIIGIATIEDLIEEILGHEIIDESDHIRHRS